MHGRVIAPPLPFQYTSEQQTGVGVVGRLGNQLLQCCFGPAQLSGMKVRTRGQQTHTPVIRLLVKEWAEHEEAAQRIAEIQQCLGLPEAAHLRGKAPFRPTFAAAQELRDTGSPCRPESALSSRRFPM